MENHQVGRPSTTWLRLLCLMNSVFVDHRNLCKNMVARLPTGIVQCDPAYEIKCVQQNVKKKYQYEILYHKTRFEMHKGKYLWHLESSVRKLPKYLEVLQKWNPCTIVEWYHIDTEFVEKKILKYVFWAFKPCIDGFQNYRKVISVDGTYLYTKYKHKFGDGALHPRVVHMLYDMGFYGVYGCGHFDMDFHLITALVERWRPETRTFHFCIGEVTVTLHNIAIIWDLPVDGQPVIGVDPMRSTEQWQNYCNHYLEFRPTSQQFRGGRILLSVLRGYLEANPVTDDTPHNELEQYARGCVLILLDSIMCPDSSGNGVSLLYL
ncbi:hypothetical protein Pfo_014997 [Paulownia fortunei]|nr:hypothetical protein Pfo_014997 [Paulownia fortunei]